MEKKLSEIKITTKDEKFLRLMDELEEKIMETLKAVE